MSPRQDARDLWVRSRDSRVADRDRGPCAHVDGVPVGERDRNGNGNPDPVGVQEGAVGGSAVDERIATVAGAFETSMFPRDPRIFGGLAQVDRGEDVATRAATSDGDRVVAERERASG